MDRFISANSVCPLITEEFEGWLTSIGYYNKPASLHYHGMRSGDLYAHCLEVGTQLTMMTEKLGLVWEREESPMLVGLLHDICKCDDYVFDGRRRKFVSNKRKSDGHGSKSVLMLKNRIDLTDEEIACIRYHMGAFTEKEDWAGYTKAVKKYPNVLWAHTADMVASQILGI